MKLISIKLRNFQGVSSFEMVADGMDCFVYGQNGAGKTTIANAESWLLFDKDSLGQSNFEIKPIGQTGTAAKPVESEVESVYENGDATIKLRKVYSEKWTKKRGSLESELTGHTTDYFIDDVPVKMGEFKTKVGEIATREDLFRLLTSPTYFNEELHWQKRRELLFSISGTLTDADVIKANPGLIELPTILNGKSSDDFKKIVMGQRKTIKETIESIPARIDEQTRSKPEITGNNSQAIIARLITLREALDKKNADIASVSSGGGMATLKNSLAAIELEIQKLQNEMAETSRGKTQGLRDELSAQKDLLAEQKRNLQTLTAEAGLAAEELKNQKEAKAALIAEYKQLISGSFTDDHCPTCHQALPAEQVEELRANFNMTKASSREKNIEKGTACAARITAIEQRIGELAALIQTATADIGVIEGRIVALSEKIAGAAGQPVEMPPALVEELAARDATLKEIREMAEGNTGAIAKLTAEKAEIQASIDEQEKQLAKIEQALAVDTRVAELKEQESKLSREFEALERQLFLIESFIKAKCSMLTDSINSKFKLVKFSLFKDQINGGVEEICEATVNGVPYGSLNHGARIQCGMEIIEVVGNFYGFHPVVFVDNRESVTDIPEVSAQVISLVVSPDDSKLRVVS